MPDTSIDTQIRDVQNNPDKMDGDSMDYNIVPPDLTEEELNERSFDLNKLFAISQIRESPHPQFDGMGYMKYNETNEMADISYIVPKKNKFDTRVTSGITHEKDSSLLGLLLSLKFDAQCTVYYKDKEMPELSTALTARVRKSEELDHQDEKDQIEYRNLLVQGTAFKQVKHICTYVPNKVVTREGDMTEVDNIKWEVMGQKKLFEGTVADLVDGKKVFLEDFYQTDIRKQVGIYTVEYIPREVIKSIWGEHPRWENVPKKCAPNGTIGAMITQGSIYSDWFFITLDFDKVEVIQAIRPFENRYQIYLNGVPMLKAGFPLTEVSPSGQCFIAKGDIDPMNMCAYSKGIPAKTKMDQVLYDSLFRIAKIKFEQSAFPPTGNNSGRLLSPDIFMPTKITRNLRREDLSVLTENEGLTAGDFSFLNMIKEQIDNKSIDSMIESDKMAGSIPIQQYLDQEKKKLIKLGGIFDGVINWKKQVAHLRLMDLLWNGPNDKNVPVKDTFENGKKGTRVLRYNKNNVVSPQDLHQEEIDYQNTTGQEVRFTDMDPEQLKSIVNDPDWYIYWEVVPTDKNNNELTKALFVSMIMQASQLFGPQSLKVQNLKQRYARVMGEKFDDIFLSPEEMSMQQPEDPNAVPGADQNKAIPSDVKMPVGVM